MGARELDPVHEQVRVYPLDNLLVVCARERVIPRVAHSEETSRRGTVTKNCSDASEKRAASAASKLLFEQTTLEACGGDADIEQVGVVTLADDVEGRRERGAVAGSNCVEPRAIGYMEGSEHPRFSGVPNHPLSELKTGADPGR